MLTDVVFVSLDDEPEHEVEVSGHHQVFIHLAVRHQVSLNTVPVAAKGHESNLIVLLFPKSKNLLSYGLPELLDASCFELPFGQSEHVNLLV